MVGEYRRWEERVWKGVVEGRVMQWGRGEELRKGEDKVRYWIGVDGRKEVRRG